MAAFVGQKRTTSSRKRPRSCGVQHVCKGAVLFSLLQFTTTITAAAANRPGGGLNGGHYNPPRSSEAYDSQGKLARRAGSLGLALLSGCTSESLTRVRGNVRVCVFMHVFFFGETRLQLDFCFLRSHHQGGSTYSKSGDIGAGGIEEVDGSPVSSEGGDFLVRVLL